MAIGVTDSVVLIECEAVVSPDDDLTEQAH
jgi:hypothetical protein